MRVYISADIEGCTGLVSWSQCGRPNSSHYDFGFARRMMTHDVNAAIRGARSAGASEVWVKDSHGTSKNLLIDELEPGTILVSGHGSGIDGMMMGLGEGPFDAAVLVGYHAMAGTQGGVMEHTITGGIHRLRINGAEVGEMGLSAGIAAEYGVPLVAATSDAAGVAEAHALVPGIVTAAVKEGYGRYMAHAKHPSETGPAIHAAVRDGIESRAQIPAVRFASPSRVEIEFNRQEEANYVARLSAFEQVDGYTVTGDFPDFRAAHTAIWNAVGMSFVGRDAGD